ncbi:MAG: BadF/BadG/BcrA/BcrD ATPase family protein [Pseudolysinimonas sp.]
MTDTAVVIAVDGGGSKTDVVALTLDGEVVARLRGGGSSPQFLGLAPAVRLIGDLVEQVMASVAPRHVLRVCIYLSGLDLAAELESFAAAIAVEPWSQPPGALPAISDNDLFALLRTGTSEPNAIAVICGTGINALGIRADGATARFPALGMISGDWGGGAFLGSEALWHAARSEDGRGPTTTLEQSVPAALGLHSVAAVTEAIHFGQISEDAISSLCPLVFDAADTGDEVAGRIVDRQAEEIVLMASTAIRRLGLHDVDVPVILGGGVLAANHHRLISAIAEGLAVATPHAIAQVMTARPIVGAGLLALESADVHQSALERARGELMSSAQEAAVHLV